MKFYSQAGQDRFVYALTGGATTGTFLDVGCSDPIVINNTYALEQLGWRGLLIDILDLKTRVEEHRKSPFLRADATLMVWSWVVDKYTLSNQIDYLSFDLDAVGAIAFARMPWDSLRFRIMTVEHDAYRFGDYPKVTMREILYANGYDLLCPDVSDNNLPFEDWWVDPLTVDMTVANIYRTKSSTPWTEIVSR